MISNQETQDCSIFYEDGKLIAWEHIPTWYVRFLSTSYPDKKTKYQAEKELRRRGNG